jgi:hypothetical protein
VEAGIARYWKDPRTGDEYQIFVTREMADEHSTLLRYCTHEKQELRWQTIADGRRQLRTQCLLCGHFSGNPLRKPDTTGDIPEADPTIAERFRRERQEADDGFWRHYAHQQEREREERKGPLPRLSRIPRVAPEAGSRTDAVQWPVRGLRRARGLGASPDYTHVGNEFLFDLVAYASAVTTGSTTRSRRSKG